MDMSPQEYQAYVKGMQKKSPLLKDMALAFVIGGAICVVGQLIQTGWLMLLPRDDASSATDFRAEGLVTGMAAKMFLIAGPVIVFGTAASVVYGVILWLLGG